MKSFHTFDEFFCICLYVSYYFNFQIIYLLFNTNQCQSQCCLTEDILFVNQLLKSIFKLN